MEQPTFSDLEYQGKKRQTRREIFLERMDELIPWQRMEERIRPYYPEAGRGRRPYELSVMLRVHCVQLFYNLSDPGMEDLLYEAESVRRFVGLRLSGPMPDESTILHFRHLVEKHELGQGLFQEINSHLEAQGLRLREGTIVDASIIEAPSSTKNRTGGRDPEMHQTKKGDQWHFGMKVHIGVDSETGVVHSMSTTAANVHDVTEAHRAAARRGVSGVGRCGVSGSPQTGGESGAGGGLAGGAAAGAAAETGPGQRGSVGGAKQGINAVEGGAPLPEGEAGVRVRQGAIPGPGEEHAAAGAAFGTGQPVDRGGSPGRVTQEQWAQILPRTPPPEPINVRNGPYGSRIRRPDIAENEPYRIFPQN